MQEVLGTIGTPLKRSVPKPLRRSFREAQFRMTYRPFNGKLSPDYDRIYHVHIRKCAGTSLNAAFLEYFSGHSDGVKRLARAPKHRLVFNGKPVVGWNGEMIDRGAYIYGFSHRPYHKITLQPKTFTFTFLRDPSDRLVSHYKMLKDMIAAGSEHPAMKREAWWAEDTFSDFLDRIPRTDLENQLYMFDPNFDIDKALTRLTELSYVAFVNDTDDFLSVLRRNFGIELPYQHRHKSQHAPVVTEADRRRMREMLAAENAFITAAREHLGAKRTRLDPVPAET